MQLNTVYILNDDYLEKVSQECYIKEGKIKRVPGDHYKIIQPDRTISIAESKQSFWMDRGKDTYQNPTPKPIPDSPLAHNPKTFTTNMVTT